MSLSVNKKNQILEYMVEKISNNEDVVNKTITNFDISKTTVYRYINKLIDTGVIKKKKRGKYILVEKQESFSFDNVDLEEDIIYSTAIEPILQKQNLPDNVMKIWYYAFTEMFNNAIEHSESKKIYCSVFYNYASVIIMIRDKGVGIFNKIKNYYNYDSVDDAIGELFKGKLTTDSKNHTGEGIFFTSRVMDMFIAVSNNRYFTHDNCDEILKTLDDDDEIVKLMKNTGTVIMMSLANRSHKELQEVFDMFTDEDGGFNKTSVPMKNVFGNNFPISRSQAKRLYNRFDKFNEIELDFQDVDEIGQAFAHELFVKFKSNHPNIKLTVKNANSQVLSMINRVRKTI